MELDNINFDNNIDNNSNISKHNISKSSIDSIPELGKINESFLRITLLVINAISLFIGIYIFFNKNYYFNDEYNFQHNFSLKFFIFLYSLGVIAAILISFVIALFYYLFKLIFIKNDQNISLCENEDYPRDNDSKNKSNSYNIIVTNANQFSLIAHTFTYTVMTIIVIYFTALIYASFMIYYLYKNNFYNNLKDFKALYLIVLLNLFVGLAMLFILIIMLVIRGGHSIRIKKMEFKEDQISNLKTTIKKSMNNRI